MLRLEQAVSELRLLMAVIGPRVCLLVWLMPWHAGPIAELLAELRREGASSRLLQQYIAQLASSSDLRVAAARCPRSCLMRSAALAGQWCGLAAALCCRIAVPALLHRAARQGGLQLVILILYWCGAHAAARGPCRSRHRALLAWRG